MRPQGPGRANSVKVQGDEKAMNDCIRDAVKLKMRSQPGLRKVLRLIGIVHVLYIDV